MSTPSTRSIAVPVNAFIVLAFVAGFSGSPTAAGAQEAANAPSFQAYSKFDFVPGEKVVALEDFAQDAIGDFPARWNTDGSGEVVTLAGKTGRWLKITQAGFFTPEFVTNLPDNFTLEFDLTVPPTFEGRALVVTLVQLENPKLPADWQTAPNSFQFTMLPEPAGGASEATSRQDGNSGVGNQANTPQLAATSGQPIHISAWRQRQRIRVYINQEKVWDVPRALTASATLNAIFFSVPEVDATNTYYVTNLRVATGAPTRGTRC